MSAAQQPLSEDDLIDHRMVRMRGLYAKEGDWVTCEEGHQIAQFARDVPVGSMFQGDELHNWKQTEPKRGQLAQPCEHCGRPWFAGMQFHFSDGWRV